MATGVGTLVGVVGVVVVVLVGVVGVVVVVLVEVVGVVVVVLVGVVGVVAANTVATPTRSVAAEEKLKIFTSFIVTSHVGDLALIIRMKESKLTVLAV